MPNQNTCQSQHFVIKLLICHLTILFMQEKVVVISSNQCKFLFMLQDVLEISIKDTRKKYLSLLELQPCSLNTLYVINELFIKFLSNRYADQVFVGNDVLIERNDEVIPVKVIDVSSLLLQGNKNHLHLSIA